MADACEGSIVIFLGCIVLPSPAPPAAAPATPPAALALLARMELY